MKKYTCQHASKPTAMKNKIALFAVAGLLLIGGARLNAAVIVWNPVAPITGDSDVNTSGTLVQALNLGSSSATTVNGVTFTSASDPSFSATNTFGTGSGNLTVNTPGTFGNGPSMGDSNAPFTNLSSSYKALVGTAFNCYQATDTTTLTINGLTSGQQYLVQFWSNDSRSSINVNNRQTLTAGNTTGIFYRNSGSQGGLGSFVIGQFTADASTQVITAFENNINGGTGVVTLNGYLISAVPEPSTFALLGLVGPALLLMRRNRRK